MLFILCSITIHTVSYSQLISSITCSADSIEIGDSFEIYYRLTLPPEVKVSQLDFTPFYEMSSLAVQDTTLKPYYAEIEYKARFQDYENHRVPAHLFRISDSRTKKELRDTFHCIAWDIGVYAIPHPLVELDTSYLGQEIRNLEPPLLYIFPPRDVINQDTTTAILPIKDIILTKLTWKERLQKYWLLLVILALSALLFLLFRIKKRQETTVIVEVPKEPAHIIALRQLNQLQKEQGWKIGQDKEHQTKLTYIIRAYLEDRFGIQALEMTTDEITKQLRIEKLSISQENEVKQILQIADLVKFAKAKPGEDINERFIEKAKQFVQETKAVIVEPENNELNG